MKKYQIHLSDWQRIFTGEVPPEFYLELLFRTLFIYILLMTAMRLMGKRMASHLNRNELIAMVSLAAAIGIPLMSPDRGLLPAVIISSIVVLVQKLISFINSRNEKFQSLSQGKLATLVTDGVMNLKALHQNEISRERLFAQLRSEQITHLGQVKRFYFESSGAFSLIPNELAVPGLSILPRYDEDFRAEQQNATDIFACYNCGNCIQSAFAPKTFCIKCEENQWEQAKR